MLSAEYGEMKLLMRNILVFMFYGCIFLNIVFAAYDRVYPEKKIDKIRALQSVSFDLKQQYPDLGIRLEPYAIDCGAGRAYWHCRNELLLLNEIYLAIYLFTSYNYN